MELIREGRSTKIIIILVLFSFVVKLVVIIMAVIGRIIKLKVIIDI